MAAVDLDVIGAVGESLTLGSCFAILTSADVDFSEQLGQGIVAEQLTPDADSTELFDQRLSTLAQRRPEVAGNDRWLIARSIEAKQPRP